MIKKIQSKKPFQNSQIIHVNLMSCLYSSLFFFLLFGSAFAQSTVTIGSGSNHTSTSYPISRFFNYSTSELLYTGAEIASTGSITAIAFDKYSGTSGIAINNVTIYMMSTASTLLSSPTCTTGYTQVYSGSFPNTGTSGWQTVTLDVPFNYTSTSQNLSILIVRGYQAAVSGASRPIYNSSSTTSALCRYYVDDSNAWTCAKTMTDPAERPNIQLTISSTPTISISSFSVTGGGSFCQGGSGVSINLSGSQVSVNYQLKNGAASIVSPLAGTGNALVWNNISGAGTYSVEASSGATTAAMTGNVSVSVTPIPSAPTTSSMSVCAGSVLTLTASNISGATYLWIGPNSFTSTVQNPTVSAIASANMTGDYTVTATVNGCVSNGVSASVTVNTLPSVSMATLTSPVCINNPTISLSGTPSGGSFSGSGVSGNVFSPSVAGAGTHTITYSFTDANSCSGISNQLITVNTCSSIREMTTSTVSLFPNPTSDKMVVYSNSIISSLKIVELTGKKCLELTQLNSTEVELELSDFAKGIYFIHLITDTHTISKKIIIK